jgi:hypothetical protein
VPAAAAAAKSDTSSCGSSDSQTVLCLYTGQVLAVGVGRQSLHSSLESCCTVRCAFAQSSCRPQSNATALPGHAACCMLHAAVHSLLENDSKLSILPSNVLLCVLCPSVVSHCCVPLMCSTVLLCCDVCCCAVAAGDIQRAARARVSV